MAAGYGGTTNNVAVGDLNNDGLADLAVSTFDGVYTLVSIESLARRHRPGRSTRRRSPRRWESRRQRPPRWATTADVALADFNRDGNLDLISVGVQYVPTVTKSDGETIDSWTNMTVDTTIQLAYGSGNGVNYTAQTQIPFQSYSSNNIDAYFSSNSSYPLFPIPFGLAAADVSGDNVPDLVLNGYTSTLQPAVFLSRRRPPVRSPARTPSHPERQELQRQQHARGEQLDRLGQHRRPSQVIAADINADGFNDVAAVEPNTGQIAPADEQGRRPDRGARRRTCRNSAAGPCPQFGLADFNLDGYADLLVPGANSYPTRPRRCSS